MPAAAPASVQPPRAPMPDAGQAMRQASAQAQTVVRTLGPEKVTGLVGGLLGVLGAVLPYYAIPSDSILGEATGVSSSLASEGIIGLLIIALAILLAAAPFMAMRSRMMSLVGFGLAVFVIGMLIGNRAISFMGQTIPVDLGAGYYLGILGFAILAFVHGRRASEA